MNIIVIVFLVVAAAALLAVPRRWAPLPLLIGTCYIPLYPQIDLGPLHFNAIRILVAVGVVRFTIRREWLAHGLTAIDRAMLGWAVWMVASSAFHKDPSSTVIFRLGLVYDACGIYVLIRSSCRSLDDISNLCQLTAILLLPLAAAMMYEQVTVRNLFSTLGNVGGPIIREGRVRAAGPFGHPILAGTVGGVCLPLMIGLWHTHRSRAIMGIGACLAIIVASASSGPILSALAGIWALFMWRYRQRIRLIQWLAVAGYIALDIVMKDPAYFLIARIDLAGGSTSWYRARLIQSSIEHISEWWLAGTDYTRHWMWVVVSWSPNHTDITSHYIQMGVYGGLPLMLLFLVVLSKGFAGVTKASQQIADLSPESGFMLWAVGSSLFAHAATMFSVSYFDQSFVFLYLPLAIICSALCLATNSAAATDSVRTANREWNDVRAHGQVATLSGWVPPKDRLRREREGSSRSNQTLPNQSSEAKAPRPYAGWSVRARNVR